MMIAVGNLGHDCATWFLRWALIDFMCSICCSITVECAREDMSHTMITLYFIAFAHLSLITTRFSTWLESSMIFGHWSWGMKMK